MSLERITKRDGRQAPFDEVKIRAAIAKANEDALRLVKEAKEGAAAFTEQKSGDHLLVVTRCAHRQGQCLAGAACLRIIIVQDYFDRIFNREMVLFGRRRRCASHTLFDDCDAGPGRRGARG